MRGRGSRDSNRACCCGPSTGRGWPVGLAACLAVGWMMAVSWVALVAHGDVANLDVKFKTGKIFALRSSFLRGRFSTGAVVK